MTPFARAPLGRRRIHRKTITHHELEELHQRSCARQSPRGPPRADGTSSGSARSAATTQGIRQSSADRARRSRGSATNYLELLTSLHKETGPEWDWRNVLEAPQPTQPPRGTAWEAQNKDQRNSWNLLLRTLLNPKKRFAELDQAISIAARASDDAAYQATLGEAQRRCGQHERQLADRVLRGDLTGYRDALDYAGAFDEVADFGTVVESASAQPDAIAVTADIRDKEIVPTEIVKTTASGKLSTKNMPKGQYWELYQDHVCSCALRLAAETFAALPVDRVIVNMGSQEISSRTGHPEFVTWLAVHFTRKQLKKINMNRIDPSDSMANFDCRMKFAKTKGFSPVEPIGFDDQFITT
ncbi:MAG: hypothetical protein R3B89_06420 [Polyangiaceae bacterium]